MEIVILTSPMPHEVGVSAFAKIISNAVVHVVEIRNCTYEKTLPFIKNAQKVVMLGTYWNQAVHRLRDDIEGTIDVYCSGACSPDEERLNFHSGENIGPSKWMKKWLEENGYTSALAKQFFKTHEASFILIDDRIYKRNIAQNQKFYSGIANLSTDLDLFGRFYSYFLGDVTLEEVMNKGAAILDSQLLMARERAVNNSKIVTLSDGVTKASITEAPELINLTHEALYELRKTDITIVVSLKFANDGSVDQLAYSLRSQNNGQTNVEDMIKLHTTNGGGDKVSAGGRVDFAIPIPF
jgi:hypothetical protein